MRHKAVSSSNLSCQCHIERTTILNMHLQIERLICSTNSSHSVLPLIIPTPFSTFNTKSSKQNLHKLVYYLYLTSLIEYSNSNAGIEKNHKKELRIK